MIPKAAFYALAMQLPALLLAIAAIYWLIRRGSGGSPSPDANREHLPESAPPPGRWVRFSEAFALALLGATILILCVTSTHSGGYLLQLGALRPEARPEYLAVMAVAALAVLGAVALVAGSGRTGLGVVFMASTLALYGAYLNMGDQTRWLKNSPRNYAREKAKREMTFEIRLVRNLDCFDFSFEGADLWFNGAYLGKTPVRITASELKRRVPHWPEPPKGFKDHPLKAAQVTPWSNFPETFPQWFRLPITDYDPNATNQKSVKHDIYYAQARLDGEQGFSTFGYSGGGGELFVMDVGATFPQAEARLSRLLAQARLKDYAVDQAWIKALDRFGEPAWNLLAHLARKEPGFNAILRQRITGLFGLDGLKTPEQNWAFFETVMKDADRLGAYDTDTTIGQAIELVAPRLDPGRLAALAGNMIPHYQLIALTYSKGAGRLEFGAVRMTEQGTQRTFNAGNPGRSGMMQISGQGSAQPFPPRAFVMAHAIWVAQRQLKAQDATRPTVFETRVAPQILRWFYSNELALRIAAALGGPEVDRFLTRQDWRTPYVFGQGRHEDAISVGMGTEVNKWFYLLATRKDAYGRAFRRDHASSVLDLADMVAKSGNLSMEPDLLDFLFLDPDQGQRSLGFEYWPRYRARVLEKKYEIFAMEMRYLVRLEPLATPQMYAQAVRDMCEAGQWDGMPIYGLFNFRRDMENLPPLRRLAALQALAAEVDREKATLSVNDHDGPEEFLRRTQYDLQQLLLLAGDPASVDALIAELVPPAATKRREEITTWLAQTNDCPPLLLERLARSDSPDLRKMAMAPIRKTPTRGNREVLARLLADPDAGVRQAAQETQAELNKLRKM